MSGGGGALPAPAIGRSPSCLLLFSAVLRELLTMMRASAREDMEGTFCIYVMLFKMRYVSILSVDVQTSYSIWLFSVLFSYDGLPFDMTSTDQLELP